MKFATWTALALAAAGALLAAARARPREDAVVRGEPRRFLVHFEDVVRNEGDLPLRDVTCDALLPIEMPRQHVRWIRLSPHGWRVRRDAQGQTVASARVPEIPPGEAACFSWIASVDLAAETHAPADAPAAEPPPDVRRYLGDEPELATASDAVRAAADEARRRARRATPLALADAAADVVRDRVRFDLSGGWDSAPTVLARGTGSCSESVFAYVAICRRLGLPARWIGGTMLRPGPAGRTCDATFHRVAEVWLPGHGWRAVETQRGRSPQTEGEDGAFVPGRLPEDLRAARTFGGIETQRRAAAAADSFDGVAEGGAGDADGASAPRASEDVRPAPPPLRRGFLVLARGDASGDAPTGTAYHSRVAWRAPVGRDGARAVPRLAKRAWWLAGVDDDLALRGAETGLGARALPSFGRAELIACDARAFGPALAADGSPIPGAAAPPSRDVTDAARLLLAAGHPEGLRLAAESWPGDDVDAATSDAVEAACGDALARAFLDAKTGGPARFEAWWAGVCDRIVPEDRGRIRLGPPTRSR